MLLRRLRWLLALEGVLLVLLGIGYGAASLTDDSQRAPAELAAGLAAVVGVVLLLLARAVGRRKGWARTPAVMLNVFPLPVGIGVLQAGVWWVGLPMMALAATALWLFATPELRDAFRESE